MSGSWGRGRNYRNSSYQDSYRHQPYQHDRRERFAPSSHNSAWSDWHSDAHNARFEAERKRERTRRLKQLQTDAERRVLNQLAEDRRLFEEQFRIRELELRQQEEEALFHDEQQALFEEEEEQQRLYAARLYADDLRQPRQSPRFAYEPIPSPHNPRFRNYSKQDMFKEQQRSDMLQQKVEAARQRFNQHYPDRQFDEELAEEEESEAPLPAEFPIILSLGKIRREIIFCLGMRERDLLEDISNAFPDLPVNYISGLRPLGQSWTVPLNLLCDHPDFLFGNSRLAISLSATPQAQTSYEENTEEDEEDEEEEEDEGEEAEAAYDNALEGEEADGEDDNEVLFDEREFFMTQDESDAVEALIEAKDPAVQLAYGAYPQLSKLVNAFVRIIRMLAVPQDGEEEYDGDEQDDGEPQDDAFDSLLSKTISWMAKQHLIDERQEQELCALAAAHDPDLLEEIRQTASLEDLIQNLRSIANKYGEDGEGGEAGEQDADNSQVPHIDAEVLHSVFEQLTNEEVSEEVMSTAMDLITNNDPDAMRAIWAYSEHRDWAHLLQTLEVLVEARKNDPEPPRPEMHRELRNQIFAMRARILEQRQVLEEKRAAHQQRNAGNQSNGVIDEEGEKIEQEWNRVSKQLEELDVLLQGQLSQLDRALDIDMDGLKNLVAVLNMDPSIGVGEVYWVKKFVEEMDPGFLDAYFEFQQHQSYDTYKERLLELIRDAEERKLAEEDEGDYMEGDEGEQAEDFGQKVLQMLYKGQLIKGKDKTILTRLLNDRDETLLGAFEELHATNNWNNLYATLMHRVSQTTQSSDENGADEDEEDYEAEGDEGDEAQAE